MAPFLDAVHGSRFLVQEDNRLGTRMGGNLRIGEEEKQVERDFVR